MWPPPPHWRKTHLKPGSASTLEGAVAFLDPKYLASQLESSQDDSDWEDDSDGESDWDNEEAVQLDAKYLVNQWGSLDCDPDWEESVIPDAWADYEIVQLPGKYLTNQLKNAEDGGLEGHSVLDDWKSDDQVRQQVIYQLKA